MTSGGKRKPRYKFGDIGMPYRLPRSDKCCQPDNALGSARLSGLSWKQWRSRYRNRSGEHRQLSVIKEFVPFANSAQYSTMVSNSGYATATPIDCVLELPR